MSLNITGRLETIKDYLGTQKFPGRDWLNIFSWKFWSEPYLTDSSPYYLFMIFFVAILVALIIWWRSRVKIAQTVAPIYQGVLNALSNLIAFVLTMSVTYYFFRSQEIANLSSRLVVLMTILVSLCYVGYAIVMQFKILPAKRLQYLEKERYFRYLPKKKERDSKSAAK